MAVELAAFPPNSFPRRFIVGVGSLDRRVRRVRRVLGA